MPKDDDERLETGTIDLRVRYVECDPMGVAHHSAYAVWFEIGRTELLRQRGIAYRDLEARGVALAVVNLRVRYRKPARYDDVLTLATTLRSVSRVRIEHEYALHRDGVLIAEGATTLACLDRDGRLRAVPPVLAGPAGADPLTTVR